METPTAAPKEKQVTPLNIARHSIREHVNQDHAITVPIGTTVKDMDRPDFWANLAPYFTQYNKIYATVDDGAWYAEFLIIACNSNSARVELLTFIQLDESVTSGDVPPIPATHEIKFRGPYAKWCVIRKSDGHILRDKMKRDEAGLWLSEYLKTTARVVA